MFRLFFISVFTLFSKTLCLGQPNLVPNPGFEEFSQCPSDIGQTILAIPWIDPTNASSDYFNLCSLNSNPFSNCFGIQAPYSGNAFVGLYAMISMGSNNREYIQVKLKEPLLSNVEYCIEFFVSLSDSSDYAVNNIGCLFSIDPIYTPTYPTNVINIIPQIINNGSLNPLTNKNDWQKIEGSFTASGGECYLTIGNFFKDDESDTVFVGGSNYSSCGYGASYYFIDNVSVKLCSFLEPIIEIPNLFSPNNDGYNDIYYIHLDNVLNYDMNIYNRWGLQIKSLSIHDSIWDGKYNGISLPEGVYFYTLNYKNLQGETFSVHGIIHLIR